MTDARPTDAAANGPRAPRGAADPSSPFHRPASRGRFTARRARVLAVEKVSPVILRVRVGGEEFADFASTGPTDHVKLFFPDPDTGELIAPAPAGPGQDGIVRPEGPMQPRDFTPLKVTTHPDGAVTVDFDFFVHPSPGPASRWASAAQPGDEIVVVGPRGSRGAPQGAARVVVIADETALPSATRWAAEVPATTAVDLIAFTEDDGAWVPAYVAETSGRADVTAHHIDSAHAADALVPALERVGVDAGTFVFAAGEASSLVGLRRHLRHELALPREQFAVSGYWKRGTAGFDHHAPIDPADPD